MIKTKNILLKKVFCLLSISLFILVACSQQTNTPSNQGSTTSTPSEDPDSTQKKELQILLILPLNSISSFSIDTWNNINFVSGNDLNKWQNAFTNSSDYEIEIMENGNENNINLETIIYSDKVSVKGNIEGTVSFRIKSISSNIMTNYTTVTFLDNSSSENNLGIRFVGTWQTNYSQGIIDTIDFYSDGTGYYSNSRYPDSGGDTFKWRIIDSTTLKITNSLGSTETCSYIFNGSSLVLTNFLGLPQNTAVTFYKE